MKDLSVFEMMELQRKLHEIHKDSWSPLTKEYARNSLLWTVEELGEVIAIVKKKGEDKIMNDSVVRNHFIEELSDVFMYLTDVMLRFDISSEEFSTMFREKCNRNMDRNYNKEYKKS